MNHQDELLPQLPTTKRLCLKCSREFNSGGPQNRICDKCCKSNERAVAPRCEIIGGLVSRRLVNAMSQT